MRPGIALLFVLFPGKRLNAEPFGAFLADGQLGWFAANVTDVTRVLWLGTR